MPETPRPTPDPDEPVDAADPAAPVGSTDPTAPTEPTEPTELTQPTEPVEVAPRPTVPAPVPSEADLERLAEPARVRRAPRFGAFLVAGGVLGFVAGVALAILTGPDSPVQSTGDGFLPFLDGQGAVRTVMGVTGAVVGVVVGGVLALVADRRSGRRAR